MVLKRKLPSQLAQSAENSENKQSATTADFEAVPTTSSGNGSTGATNSGDKPKRTPRYLQPDEFATPSEDELSSSKKTSTPPPPPPMVSAGVETEHKEGDSKTVNAPESASNKSEAVKEPNTAINKNISKPVKTATQKPAEDLSSNPLSNIASAVNAELAGFSGNGVKATQKPRSDNKQQTSEKTSSELSQPIDKAESHQPKGPRRSVQMQEPLKDSVPTASQAEHVANEPANASKGEVSNKPKNNVLNAQEMPSEQAKEFRPGAVQSAMQNIQGQGVKSPENRVKQPKVDEPAPRVDNSDTPKQPEARDISHAPKASDEGSTKVSESSKQKTVADNSMKAPIAPAPSFADEPASNASSASTPWEANTPQEDDWDVSEFIGKAPDTGDIYADADKAVIPASEQSSEPESADEIVQQTQLESESSTSSETLPPWAQGSSKPVSGVELPGADMPEKTNGSPIINILAVAAVVGVVFGGYMLFKNSDKSQEVLARWTGTLDEVSQEVPGETMSVAESASSSTFVQPEEVLTIGDTSAEGANMSAETQSISDLLKSPSIAPTGTAAVASATSTAEVDSTKHVEIDFVSVPKEELQKPIESDNSTEMPEDVSLFASLQSAIVKAKEEKAGGKVVSNKPLQKDIESSDLPLEEKMQRSYELQLELEDELDAYRKALASASTPVERPKPGEFFNEYAFQTSPADGASKPSLDGLPSPQVAQPQQPVFNANPYNLPVIPEPKADAKPSVRTLDDFDVEFFKPERRSVRVPKGLRPRMTANDFPQLELLSLVPNKGIIATTRGKQGFLLIGETLEGWELVAVKSSYAEFSNGQRKQTLALSQ